MTCSVASVTINGRGSMLITRKDSVQTIEFIHNSPVYKKEKIVAETDKYKLIYRSYVTKPGFGDVCEAIVILKQSGEEVYKTTVPYCSVYGSFLENHPSTGHDYVFISPYGLLVIDITTGEWVDVAASGFHIVEYTFSPNKKSMICNGCFWGGPYTDALIDIENPLLINNKNVYHFGSSNEEINFQCWCGDKIIECESEIFERCDDECDTVHSHHTNAVDKHKLFINIESIRNGHY